MKLMIRIKIIIYAWAGIAHGGFFSPDLSALGRESRETDG